MRIKKPKKKLSCLLPSINREREIEIKRDATLKAMLMIFPSSALRVEPKYGERNLISGLFNICHPYRWTWIAFNAQRLSRNQNEARSKFRWWIFFEINFPHTQTQAKRTHLTLFACGVCSHHGRDHFTLHTADKMYLPDQRITTLFSGWLHFGVFSFWLNRITCLKNESPWRKYYNYAAKHATDFSEFTGKLHIKYLCLKAFDGFRSK